MPVLSYVIPFQKYESQELIDNWLVSVLKIVKSRIAKLSQPFSFENKELYTPEES